MGLWAIFGMTKSRHYQIAALSAEGAMVLEGRVCSKSASGKSEDLTRAAAPEEKVSLGPANPSSG